MKTTTKALLIGAALFSLPAFANHHSYHSDADAPAPEVCVEWRQDDGGITDAGPNEIETEDDGGTLTDVLPCARKEPVGCSSTTGGTMAALAVLVGLLKRRRN